MVDPATFRDVMSQWPSGVTVVTTLGEGDAWHGMTASSFSSVSLDPPLVSICLTKTLYSHQLISASGVFGINVLAKDQIDVGRRFAGMDKVEDRFAGESWTTADTGVPLLDSALGWFDCRVVHAYPGGDHTIFVGEVMEGHAARKSAPLLFHSRGWGQFADVLPDVATLSDSGVVSGLVAAGHGPETARIAGQVADAGVRVRVADISDGRTPVEGVLPRFVAMDRASVVVADRAQADRVLASGIGTVEFIVDPTDPAAVTRTVEALDGIADRAAVTVIDPFDAVRLDLVLSAVQQFARAGVAEIALPDTAGGATPLTVRGLLQEAVALARPVPLRLGLHDRDRLGLVKALTALKSGVRHFDTTVAGLDEAVATEDLIRLLDEVDVDTPVDAEALVQLAQTLRGPAPNGSGTAQPPPCRPGSAPHRS
ncbi:flavin reductase [Nocardioides alcanivorans]|uniref:flavin reductase n=1 Tax=Nocardioides alcanivorans TaxID=2897352 RepID=UPI001F1D7669|nr:flavin reductase [Nocardioides alcanivorans]